MDDGGLFDGVVLASRYRLSAPLGRGAHGEVWRGEDTVVGARVAVKVLFAEAGAETARVRREAAALRMLRVPGVVRLLDEGVHGQRAFLVMEMIDGDRFPGARVPRPCAWADSTLPTPGARGIAGVAEALLETLSRVHSVGVVHRDLKPDNVRVTPEGQPILLDFGISQLAALRGGDLAGGGMWLGTPAYAAPEQIRGGPVSAATDLYAVGVMLFEALSGGLPHDAPDPRAALRNRLANRPPPLANKAAGVPRAVAETVDRMLSPSPEDRPRSAAEVLRSLRGERSSARSALPWLGPVEPIERAVSALREGRSVDVVGPRGGGRSRLALEVASRLRAEGRRTVALVQGDGPFSSLEPLVGTWAGHEDEGLEGVRAAADRALSGWAREGGVVIADDAAGLDRRTAERLAAMRAGAPVLAVFREGEARPEPPASVTVVLAPLPPGTLLPLFVGRDRLFHARADAAAALWERTSGLPGRVAEELAAWTRAGIAEPLGEAHRVGQEALDALETGVLFAPMPADGARDAPIPQRLADIAVCAALAGPNATVPLLSSLTGRVQWQVEADLEDLVGCGVLRTGAGGAHRACAPIDAGSLWPAERVARAHRDLAAALPRGARNRLFHLLAAGSASVQQVAEEALAAAERLLSRGRTGQAVAVIEEGVRALRVDERPVAGDAGALAESLFTLWLRAMSADATPQAADRLLYELERTSERTPKVQRIEDLARAALESNADLPRALDRLDAMLPAGDAALDRCWAALRMFAARSMSREREEVTLVEVAAWASASNDAETLARLDGWRGRVRYQQGLFDEAADLHLRSAERLERPPDRIAARINAASALLEAFRLEEALSLGRDCLADLADNHHPFLGARAEWIVRAARYRLGEDLSPDMDLAFAVAAVGVQHMEALVSLTEAAIAWRAGDLPAARTLALQADAAWRTIRALPQSAAIARSLSVVCGEPASKEALILLGDQAAKGTVAWAAIQVLGLLALARPALRSRWKARARKLCEKLPSKDWQRRMEVLCVDEARRALGIGE